MRWAIWVIRQLTTALAGEAIRRLAAWLKQRRTRRERESRTREGAFEAAQEQADEAQDRMDAVAGDDNRRSAPDRLRDGSF